MVQTAKNQLFVALVSPTEPLKPDVFHSQTLSPLEIVLFATFTHYRSICEAHVFQKTTFYHVRHGYLLVSPFSSGLNLQTNNSKTASKSFDDAKANGVYRRISVYEKTHRYWAIAKSRASQINYIEGVYHGIVRSVLKVEGYEWAFCDDESNVSFGKERWCFRGVLTMDSSYLNKDVSDYPFGSGGAIRYI